MSSFRSSTDNYSGDTLTNANTSSSTSSSSSTLSSPIYVIGDEEPPTPLPIHILSRPCDWACLLHSMLFAHGQRSVIACLSLIYIVARLPLAGWSVYQIYRFAIGSTAGGIAVLVVVFLMWITEKESGLEKKCWGVLVWMARVLVVEERRREGEMLRRWEERQQRDRVQWSTAMEMGRDGCDLRGGDEDGSLEAWMGETSTLRDEQMQEDLGKSDTTKLL